MFSFQSSKKIIGEKKNIWYLKGIIQLRWSIICARKKAKLPLCHTSVLCDLQQNVWSKIGLFQNCY